ncbi:DUF2267 domain-containing protein [bacterium]|nr:DUF2267 domain-containing protein [bacterium]
MTELEFWKRLQDFLAIEDMNRVKALGAKVLEMLSARLAFQEAEDLKAQLPAGLKTIWERHEREMHKWNREQFVAKIREECLLENTAEAERVVRGVFGVLQEGISPGEAEDVEAQLPKDMKPLWESAGVAREKQAGEEARRIIY